MRTSKFTETQIITILKQGDAGLAVKRSFTSNHLVIEDWTPNRLATQSRGDVAWIAAPATAC